MPESIDQPSPEEQWQYTIGSRVAAGALALMALGSAIYAGAEAYAGNDAYPFALFAVIMGISAGAACYIEAPVGKQRH